MKGQKETTDEESQQILFSNHFEIECGEDDKMTMNMGMRKERSNEGIGIVIIQ